MTMLEVLSCVVHHASKSFNVFVYVNKSVFVTMLYVARGALTSLTLYMSRST